MFNSIFSVWKVSGWFMALCFFVLTANPRQWDIKRNNVGLWSYDREWESIYGKYIWSYRPPRMTAWIRVYRVIWMIDSVITASDTTKGIEIYFFSQKSWPMGFRRQWAFMKWIGHVFTVWCHLDTSAKCSAFRMEQSHFFLCLPRFPICQMEKKRLGEKRLDLGSHKFQVHIDKTGGGYEQAQTSA